MVACHADPHYMLNHMCILYTHRTCSYLHVCNQPAPSSAVPIVESRMSHGTITSHRPLFIVYLYSLYTIIIYVYCCIFFRLPFLSCAAKFMCGLRDFFRRDFLQRRLIPDLSDSIWPLGIAVGMPPKSESKKKQIGAAARFADTVFIFLFFTRISHFFF